MQKKRRSRRTSRNTKSAPNKRRNRQPSSATLSGKKLSVKVTTSSGSITLTSNVSGSGSCVVNRYERAAEHQCQAVLRFLSCTTGGRLRGGTARRTKIDPFYKVYPSLWGKIGNYSAWAWGISRLIDGLVQVKDQMNVDMNKIARGAVPTPERCPSLAGHSMNGLRSRLRRSRGRWNQRLENVSGLRDPHGHQYREDRQHQLQLVHVQHEEPGPLQPAPRSSRAHRHDRSPSHHHPGERRTMTGWVMNPATNRPWPPSRSSRPWEFQTISATISRAATPTVGLPQLKSPASRRSSIGSSREEPPARTSPSSPPRAISI